MPPPLVYLHIFYTSLFYGLDPYPADRFKVDSEAVVDSGYGADEDEEVIVPDRLLEPKVIQTVAELDNWLASLRDKLAAVLKLHKRIRIKGDK